QHVAFRRDRQHAAIVEHVPPPLADSPVQLLPTVEDRLHDGITVVPHADHVPRQEGLEGGLPQLRIDFVRVERTLHYPIQAVEHALSLPSATRRAARTNAFAARASRAGLARDRGPTALDGAGRARTAFRGRVCLAAA